MNKQRKFLLISSVVGFISMFLPWVSISMFGYTQSVNGMHREGVIVFLCFVATGIIAYVDDQRKNLNETMWTATLLAGTIALLFTVWYYSEISYSLMGAAFVGFGLYIAAIASVGILLSAFLLRSKTDNLKEGLGGLKDEFKRKFRNATTTADSSQEKETLQKTTTSKDNLKP